MIKLLNRVILLLHGYYYWRFLILIEISNFNSIIYGEGIRIQWNRLKLFPVMCADPYFLPNVFGKVKLRVENSTTV